MGSKCRSWSSRAAFPGKWKVYGSLVSPVKDLGSASRRARPTRVGGQTPDQSVHLLTSGSVCLSRSPYSRNPGDFRGDRVEEKQLNLEFEIGKENLSFKAHVL